MTKRDRRLKKRAKRAQAAMRRSARRYRDSRWRRGGRYTIESIVSIHGAPFQYVHEVV